jgi:hypothetical protein
VLHRAEKLQGHPKVWDINRIQEEPERGEKVHVARVCMLPGFAHVSCADLEEPQCGVHANSLGEIPLPRGVKSICKDSVTPIG